MDLSMLAALKQAYVEDGNLMRTHNNNGKKYRQGKMSQPEWVAFKTQWQKDHIAKCEEIGTLREQLADLADTIDTQTTDSKDAQFNENVVYPPSFVSNISKMHYLLAMERKITGLYDINDDKFSSSKEGELHNNVLENLRVLKKELRGGWLSARIR